MWTSESTFASTAIDERVALIFRTTIIALFSLNVAFAQQLKYSPEIVTGHRSITYLHSITYSISDHLRFNNLTLYDTEYETNQHNIFFIRNTMSYQALKSISLNAAIGIKNPGSFVTFTAQYQFARHVFLFSYAAGTTYQSGFTLEQSILLEYAPMLTNNIKGYFKVQAVANTNSYEYQRGFQQFRAGLKYKGLAYGLAMNLDQFKNSTKTLENLGGFLKCNFN